MSKENYQNKTESLLSAITQGNGSEAIKIISQCNESDLSQIASSGMSSIEESIKKGLITVATILIRENPQLLNIQDSTGNTALHAAAESQSSVLTDTLIAHSVNDNIRDKSGNRALDMSSNPDIKKRISAKSNTAIEPDKKEQAQQDFEAIKIIATNLEIRFPANTQDLISAYTNDSKIGALTSDLDSNQGIDEVITKCERKAGIPQNSQTHSQEIKEEAQKIIKQFQKEVEEKLKLIKKEIEEKEKKEEEEKRKIEEQKKSQQKTPSPSPTGTILGTQLFLTLGITNHL